MKNRAVPILMFVFTVSGCGGDSSDAKSSAGLKSENASVCFNNNLYTVGSEYALITKEDSNAAEIISYKVLDEMLFKGQSAVRVQVTDASSSAYTYFSVDENNKSYSLLGFTEGDIESYYTPGKLAKFNIKSGNAYEQTLTLIHESPKINSEFVYNHKTIFKGLESITVPAGTYNTCKFESNYSVTTPDGGSENLNYTMWYAVEYGFSVKLVSDKSTTELIEAKINGAKI